MAIKFNPFTGTFDFTGSGGGGGGASYIDGEVATYADLPLDGSATLNSAWLVRTASGVWPVTRKQAGIYIRTATGGSNRDSDYTYAGTMPDVFSDSQFLLYDNSDTSKNLAFDLGSITTGTTRTLTAPDASGRIQIEGHPIGNTTPAAGTFTTLTANNGTLTASAPAFSVGQTWNDASTVFHAAEVNVTVTNANANSTLFRVMNGATTAFSVTRFNVVNSAGGFNTAGNITSTLGNISLGGQVTITQGGSGIFEQRSGTAAQTFNIYNTFTSTTNHERGFLKWSSNVFQIGTEKGSGGGTARALEFQTDGTTRMTMGATGLIGIGAAPSTHLVNISGAVNGGFSAQLTNTGTNPEGWCILLPNMAAGGSRAIFYGGTALTTRNGFGLNFVNVASGSTSNRIAFSFNAVDDIFILRADRRAGINTTAPDRALEINDASGGCLRLTHNDSNGSATNFCDMTVASDGVTTIAPSGTELVITKNVNIGTRNLVTDTTTGTKIGTGTTQLLGFWNATPAAQPAAVADATDAASVITQLNALLSRLRTLGLIAT
jgi:hypothetical protein